MASACGRRVETSSNISGVEFQIIGNGGNFPIFHRGNFGQSTPCVACQKSIKCFFSPHSSRNPQFPKMQFMDRNVLTTCHFLLFLPHYLSYDDDGTNVWNILEGRQKNAPFQSRVFGAHDNQQVLYEPQLNHATWWRKPSKLSKIGNTAENLETRCQESCVRHFRVVKEMRLESNKSVTERHSWCCNKCFGRKSLRFPTRKFWGGKKSILLLEGWKLHWLKTILIHFWKRL